VSASALGGAITFENYRAGRIIAIGADPRPDGTVEYEVFRCLGARPAGAITGIDQLRQNQQMQCASYSGRPLSHAEIVRSGNQAEREFLTYLHDASLQDAILVGVRSARSRGELRETFDADPNNFIAEVWLGSTPLLLVVPKEGPIDQTILQQLVHIFAGPRSQNPREPFYGEALATTLQNAIRQRQVASAGHPAHLLIAGEQLGQATRWHDIQGRRTQECVEILRTLSQVVHEQYQGLARSAANATEFTADYLRAVEPIGVLANQVGVTVPGYLAPQTPRTDTCALELRALRQRLGNWQEDTRAVVARYTDEAKASDWQRQVAPAFRALEARAQEVVRQGSRIGQ